MVLPLDVGAVGVMRDDRLGRNLLYILIWSRYVDELFGIAIGQRRKHDGRHQAEDGGA
jgi:hypothetical protein